MMRNDFWLFSSEDNRESYYTADETAEHFVSASVIIALKKKRKEIMNSKICAIKIHESNQIF